MDPIRPLAGLTVVLVFGTGVITGIQLSHGPDHPHSTASPAPALTSPSSGSIAPPTTPPGPSQQAQVPLPTPPQVAAPAPGQVAPPAAPIPPQSAFVGRPAAPTPADIARTQAAQRHAATYARLRRQAILLCREWGFSRARCDTAPK